MSLINAGFRIPFCSSLTSLVALIFLTACQPLIQAQTGAKATIPVISPSLDKASAPAEQNQPTAPALTTLTAEDLAAAPLRSDTSLGEQPVNTIETRVPEQSAVKITLSSKPEKPVAKPTFNPADLVGQSLSYVSAQFGKADFSRTEGIIHVLQYRQPDCVIDLFINIDGTTDSAPTVDAKILNWAMRGRKISQLLDPTLCQQQFYERKL